MKKGLILFLAVLMLITFVSCNQKALEEAEKREQATIDFFETFKEAYIRYSELMEKSKAGTYDLSKYSSTNPEDATAKANAEEMVGYLKRYNNLEYLTDFKVGEPSGTVKIEFNTDETMGTLVAKGVEIPYSYKKEGQTINVKLSFSVEMTQQSVKDEKTGDIVAQTVMVTSFMLNGKAYRTIEMTSSNSLPIEIKKATCDGIDLNLKVVTSAINLTTPY